MARSHLLASMLVLFGCDGSLGGGDGATADAGVAADGGSTGSLLDGSIARHGSTSDAPPSDAASIDAPTTAVLDPALEIGPGPSGCPERLCGRARAELPLASPPRRNAPTTVVPEPPRIERRLRMSEPTDPSCRGDACRGRALGPILPAFRTTTDGRVALTGGGAAAVSAVRLDGYDGAPLIRHSARLHELAYSREVPIDIRATPPAGAIGRSASPDRFLCAADQAPTAIDGRDCYDVTMVEDWQSTCDGATCGRFASIRVRICVADPKSRQASIASAHTIGDWSVSQRFDAHTAEPLVTADGRMVTFRLLGAGSTDGDEGVGMHFAFRRDDGTAHPAAVYSLVYAYSARPCDVAAWFDHPGNVYSSLRPLSSAHFDRRLTDYGFAAYPLRDAYGAPFAEGELVRGSYPWMDREGNNMIFSTIVPGGSRGDADGATRRYPMAFEYPGVNHHDGRSPRGFAIAGSWTHGKIVMLDDLLNNEDYGIDAGDTRRYGLYRSAGGANVAARVDGNSNTRAYGTAGTRGNSQHIESLENTFYMHPGFAPVTPRDVVWTFSRGDFLEEVVFDDYLDPHVVLLAPMNAAWRMGRSLGPGEGAFASRAGSYRDGFDTMGDGFVHDPSQIDLQNAATSPIYPMPSRGRVRGDARVEPVANGGIEGRGMWLEGDASLRFAFPDDQPLPERTFYASVFVDVRGGLDGGRQLLEIRGTNGATHVLLHPGGISVQREGEVLEIGSYPVAADHPYRPLAGVSADGGWHHVGVLFSAGDVTVFLDGDPVGVRRFASPLILGAGADLIVGGAFGAHQGIRGWVDEARVVIAGEVNQLEEPASIELLCNYARGTMARVRSTDSGFALAERAPFTRARAVDLGLDVPAAERIRCVTDYTADHRVRVADLGARSLRREILERLAGDATLHAGMPRPDTRGNAFCTSCHVERALDADRPSALLLAALRSNSIAVEDDPRTQPHQPWARPGSPALVHGVVPAEWMTSVHGVALPVSRRALSEPYPILDWVLRE